jgi:hypothetical protein
MKKLLIAVVLLAGLGIAHADDNAFFKVGPLSLNIPLKTARVTYLYDFNANQNLVGGETPFASLWDRVEGTVGAVTSLEGQGTPFVGGNVLLGNLLEKYVSLPADLTIGGFGGYNFNSEAPIYGIKAGMKLW